MEMGAVCAVVHQSVTWPIITLSILCCLRVRISLWGYDRTYIEHSGRTKIIMAAAARSFYSRVTKRRLPSEFERGSLPGVIRFHLI